MAPRPYPRPLAPAPPRRAPQPTTDQYQPTSFYDLPAELRIEIYKLVLLKSEIWIIDNTAAAEKRRREHRQQQAHELQQSPYYQPQESHLTNYNLPPYLGPIPHIPLPLPHLPSFPPRQQHRNQRHTPTRPSHPPDFRDRPHPHPLLLTSRQIRLEVIPLVHSLCPIHAPITDFEFGPLLQFLDRIPVNEIKHLLKNPKLTVTLYITKPDQLGPLANHRTWLHRRADKAKNLAEWKYEGERPNSRVCNDLRRRYKRMTEAGKRDEFGLMLKGLGVALPEIDE